MANLWWLFSRVSEVIEWIWANMLRIIYWVKHRSNSFKIDHWRKINRFQAKPTWWVWNSQAYRPKITIKLFRPCPHQGSITFKPQICSVWGFATARRHKQFPGICCVCSRSTWKNWLSSVSLGIETFCQIPTGFHPSAQGCAARATLGQTTKRLSTATRLRPIGFARNRPQRRWRWIRFQRVTQGRRWARQPWALSRNSVGIEDQPIQMRCNPSHKAATFELPKR